LARARTAPLRRQIDPRVLPEPGDFVVVSGAHLQRLCAHRGLLHLCYAGFAANICVPHKDCSVRAFAERGYHCILLRDCTTAVESHDTVHDLSGTRQAIRELELDGKAATTTADAFIRACGAGRT